MSEDMKVRVELWPVAADEVGLWLLSGVEPLRSRNVPADGDEFDEAECLLAQRGMRAKLLHQTSARCEGPAHIVVFLAAIETGGLSLGAHPSAKPITEALRETVGKPLPHAPAEAPTPRWIDALFHGLRHFALLRDFDDDSAEAFDEHWLRELDKRKPALYRMYRRTDPLAA